MGKFVPLRLRGRVTARPMACLVGSLKKGVDRRFFHDELLVVSDLGDFVTSAQKFRPYCDHANRDLGFAEWKAEVC